MKAQCIHCLTIYNPPDENHGKQVFCPKCHQSFIIVPFVEPVDAQPKNDTDTEVKVATVTEQPALEKKQPEKTDNTPPNVAKKHKGIRRFWFSLFIIPTVAVATVLLIVALQDRLYIPALGRTTVNTLLYFGTGVLLIIALLLIAGRLRNIGSSAWWTLMIFVHPVHIILAVKCFICPQGYRHNKKLDRAGKIWLWFFIILITTAIIAAVLFLCKQQGWLFAKQTK